MNKVRLPVFLLALLFAAGTAHASPWAEGKTYGEKTGGKAVFGVKNTLLGWTAFWTEQVKYGYYLEKKTAWEGMMHGIAKSVLYTGTGAIQLVTFPIPVDFPNMGEGVLQTSVRGQAEREQGKKLSSQEVIAGDAMKSELNDAAAFGPGDAQPAEPAAEEKPAA